jgi:hypothetical protein
MTHGDACYRAHTCFCAGSILQGFGRIQLENVLWFSDTDQFSLFVLDGETALNGKDRDVVVPITADGSLKVTLAWSDAPAQVNADLAAVNNLDLIVGRWGAAPAVQHWRPLTSARTGRTVSELWAGNFKDKRDERNNVEHVILNVKSGDSVKVRRVAAPPLRMHAARFLVDCTRPRSGQDPWVQRARGQPALRSGDQRCAP